MTTFSGSPCPEVIFGALSRLTKRIRLGFGVSVLPYHHPVRVAERVAMVERSEKCFWQHPNDKGSGAPPQWRLCKRITVMEGGVLGARLLHLRRRKLAAMVVVRRQ